MGTFWKLVRINLSPRLAAHPSSCCKFLHFSETGRLCREVWADTSAPWLVSSEGWWQRWRRPCYRPGTVRRDPLIHPARLGLTVGALAVPPDPQPACPRFRDPMASLNLQSGKEKLFQLPDSWDHLFQIILRSPNVYNLTLKQQPTRSDPAPSSKLDLGCLP